MKLVPLTRCHGGKFYLTPWLNKYIPPHDTYYELFLGGGSLFLNKVEAKNSVLNELDLDLYYSWFFLKEESEAFINELNKIPYSEAQFDFARTLLNSDYFNPFLRAVHRIVLGRMSRGGLCKHFSKSTRLRSGRDEGLNSWENFKLKLPVMAAKLKSANILNLNALNILEQYEFNKDCFLYIDPPYLKETRTAKNVYKYEMIQEDHVTMLETCIVLPCKIAISAYENTLYDEILGGWRKEKKEVANRSSQSKTLSRRVEVLYLNY